MNRDRGFFSRPTSFLRNIPPYWLDIGAVLLLLLATLLINLPMLRFGLTGLGDLRWHITWIQHFSHQIAEGILYPRWLAGTNFGYGSPTFVFYPPLVYYIGSFFKLIGLSSEQTLYAVFSLAVFLCGLSFYLYGRGKWGRLGALGGAFFYMTSPYLFGILSGGGLASLFALAWIPIGVYTIDRAIESPRWRIPLAFLWMFVALTHNPSLLVYGIAGGLYTLIAGLQRSLKTAIITLVFMALGLTMASFFLVPVFLEQPFTNVGYVIDFSPNYLRFLTLLQNNFRDPFFRELVAFAFLAAGAWFLDASLPGRRRQVVGALLAIGITLFLLSDWSSLLWQASALLRKLQRVPRIIVILYFAGACLYAMAIDACLRVRRVWKFFPLTLIALIIFFNLRGGLQAQAAVPGLHSPGKGKVFIREWLETSLYDPFSDKLVDVPEYRPLLPTRGEYPPFSRERYSDWGVPLTSPDRQGSPLPVPRLGEPRFSLLRGEARVEIERWSSYDRRLQVEALTPITLRIRLYVYPAWQLFVNGQARPLEMADDGTVLVELEPGTYTLELKYGVTKPLVLGISLSLLALILVIGYGFFLGRQNSLGNSLGKTGS